LKKGFKMQQNGVQKDLNAIEGNHQNQNKEKN
jgi:hypothetical protein